MTLESIVPIVVGATLVAGSRWIADNFKVPGEHAGGVGAAIRLGGLYDNYASRLYRWVTCVLTGAVLIVVGLVSLRTD